MRFEPLAIEGAFALSLEPIQDERGFFARTSCGDELNAHGLVHRFSQSSLSFNRVAGTLRGMHYSVGAAAETKLVRCTAGAVWDVLVDVRTGSATFGRAISLQLDSENRLSLYVPHGVAHGFLTLADGTELLYMIDKPFDASAARGLRWNDPFVAVDWPAPVSIISARDADYPDFTASGGT